MYIKYDREKERLSLSQLSTTPQCHGVDILVPKFFTTTLDGYQWSDPRPDRFISEERTTIPIGKEAIATKFVRFPKYIF
jgi:hypothetical protein